MSETPLPAVAESTTLALPDPQSLAAAQVPALVERVVVFREWLRSEHDVAGADDLRRRLAAYERYVADKKARRALEAESRRTEVLIGELLGPADWDRKPYIGKGLSNRDRHVFRELAAHVDVVEECLVAGVTARAKILVRIERLGMAERGDGAANHSIRSGDFRDVLEDVPDESVDLIFTDPPYDKAAVDLYGDLAAFGSRVLKPGGSLLAYCGQYALPTILRDMQEHLRYWWMCACVHDGGNHKSLPGIKTYVIWKPIVWFVKNTNSSTEFVYDAILRPAPQKKSHDWEQSLAEPLHYIEKLCPPGGLVCDPFTGGGTTRIAAEQLGRGFIGAEIHENQRQIAIGRQA